MRPLINMYNDAGAKQTPSAGDGATFTLIADTYFVEFFDDAEDRKDVSVHWKWNAALEATITIEASNRSRDDVTPYAATGSGWATTGATTVSPAASASEVVANYTDQNAARQRAKIVVTTGGTLRGDEHSKPRGGR